jgi:preprotein translocase subunit SecA
LRQGINLRAYAQRDPLNEYKSEAFALFNAMLGEVREKVSSVMSRVQIQMQPQQPLVFPGQSSLPPGAQETRTDPALAQDDAASQSRQAPSIAAAGGAAAAASAPSPFGKVPRNAPCPCGSGKKYKHCHGIEG